MGKQLIYFDEKAALKEIEGRTRLISALNRLIKAYDTLRLNEPFSKDVFIGLVEIGTNYLYKPARESLSVQLRDAISPLISSDSIEPDLSTIKDSIFEIKIILVQESLNPYTINFKGPEPDFSDQDKKMIQDSYRYYAETDEEKKLYRLVQDYCKASNELDYYSKINGNPGFNEGLIMENRQFYIDFQVEDDSVKIAPNPFMFRELEAIKKWRNRNQI